MNLLQPQGLLHADGDEKSSSVPYSASNNSMADDGAAQEARTPAALAAHEDAREIIRLIQCVHCSRPYDTPITLPCGHSMCRRCLPPQQPRENISYPNTPGRQNGVRCRQCELLHAVGECKVDVTLTKVMESVSEAVAEHRADVNFTIVVDEVPSVKPKSYGVAEEGSELKTWEVSGGRLFATFDLAQRGELKKTSDLVYRPSPTDTECQSLDISFLNHLRDSAYKELDCQVCYGMMLDPVTTTCGHSFCRKCLARVLDHSRQCPFCRRTLPMPPSLMKWPSNAALCQLLQGLCPELVASRAEAVKLEEHGTGDSTIPLFVCTLSFPGMPTFLHIFEPRYRLMIRRAMEGNRRFGMVMYNRTGVSQGELGISNYLQYGTLLEIVNHQYEPDGRCYIETRGVGRFKIRSDSILDGYSIGQVERVDDISLTEEEGREAAEITAAEHMNLQRNGHENGRQAADNDEDLDAMPTIELLSKGMEFIEGMQHASATWLSERIVEAYGGPPEDPATFPYWFASVLPIQDEEKYVLLHTTSVRERLKIVVRWIRKIERQSWFNGSACAVL